MARLESQNAELAQQLQATVQVLRQMFPAPAAPPPPVPPFNPQDPRFQGYTPPSPFQGDPGPYGP